MYRRSESGWEREEYAGTEATIPLPEVRCELALAELYENVEFVPVRPDEDWDE